MGAPFIPRAVLMFLLVLLPCLKGDPQVSSMAGGTIAGMVADSQGGEISGARITMIEDSTGRNYDTATDCSGRYRRSGLPAGSYHLRFEAPEFRTETKYSVHVSPSQITNLDGRLQLGLFYKSPEIVIAGKTQPTGAIRGTVTDPTGAAVPARITVTKKTSGTDYETTTDSQGVYWLADLPEGTYWLRFEAAGFDSGSRQEVVVKPSDVTYSDVRLPDAKETIEVCTDSCMIYVDPVPPVHRGIELKIYAPSNVVTAGSELSLTVTLKNITGHPIFIHAEKNPGPAFGYQIYAFGRCNCPGKLYWRKTAVQGSSGPIHRVPPGETLTHKVKLRTPTDLLWPGTYMMVVKRPDISSEVNCCEEPKNPPSVRSNEIKVTVMAAR